MPARSLRAISVCGKMNSSPAFIILSYIVVPSEALTCTQAARTPNNASLGGASSTTLGTEFNVNTYKNFFEVKCFSGLVEAYYKADKKQKLTKGKAIRKFRNETINWSFNENNADWTSGKNTFNRTPLSEVIKKIENQFGVTFQNIGQFKNEIFTGSFQIDNLDIVLKTVFGAMQIEYKYQDKKVILKKTNNE